MGTQQLLMIVLGVIIVGVAIVVGINMFSQGAVNAESDRLVQEVNVVGSNAAAYWRKPTQMGGGGRDFTGVTLSDLGAQDSTANTKLAITSTDVLISITAEGLSEHVIVTADINEDGVVGGTVAITKP
ncbi:MAG: hypothetical protein KAW56_14510 [Candidatus Marinimicrobia bacterium]|nr:hypothetical protein [Candidatus Neomarinimicrobiota bacterium]